MNFKTTIVLLLLVILLGSYFILTREHRQQFDPDALPTETSGGIAVFGIDRPLNPDNVTTITVTHQSETASFTRDAGAWRQTQPIDYPATDWSINDAVRRISELKYLQQFTPGSAAPTLEELGLDQPQATVTITTESDRDGGTYHMLLGKQTRTGVAYLKFKDGDHVLAVRPTLHQLVADTDFTDWRRKSIAAPEVARLTELAVNFEGRTIELVQRDGQWTLAGDHRGRAGQSSIEDLVNALDTARAERFAADQPESLASFGLDQPRIHVALTQTSHDDDLDHNTPDPAKHHEADPSDPGEVGDPSDPGEPATDAGTDGGTDEVGPEGFATDAATGRTMTHHLRIGSPTDLSRQSFFATWTENDQTPQTVMVLPKSVIDKLDVTAADLRDPRITTARADDVRELKVTGPNGHHVKLIKTADGWQFQGASEPAPTPDGPPADTSADSPAFPADQALVRDMVTAITTAESDQYRTPLDLADGAEPAWQITMGLLGRADAERIRLYALDGQADTFVARRLSEPVGYVIPRSDLEAALEPAYKLRDRQVVDVEPADVHRIELTRPDGQSFTLVRTPSPNGTAAASADSANTDDPAADTDAAASQQDKDVADSGQGNDAQASEPGPWRLVGHDELEQQAAADLANTLARLRAVNWLTPDTEFQGPQASAVLTTHDGRTVRLAVATDMKAARVSGIPVAFEVSERVVEMMNVELRPRTVLGLRADQIASVTVSDQATAMTMTIHRDEQGTLKTQDDRALDTEAAGGLIDTLAGLRAQRFVTREPESEPVRTIMIQMVGPDAAARVTSALGDDAADAANTTNATDAADAANSADVPGDGPGHEDAANLSLTLTLFDHAGAVTASLGQQVFVVSESDANRLLAALSADDASTK